MNNPGYGSGGPYGQYPPSRPPMQGGATVNGALLLILGIVGLFCCNFLGPVAWVLANNAMVVLDSGSGQESERGMVTAARILGILGTIVLALLVIYFLYSIFVGFTFLRSMNEVLSTQPTPQGNSMPLPPTP